MIDATLLFKGMIVFSPWFPRQADMLRVTAECVTVEGASIKIELWTKSAEDTGDGDPVDENTYITLSGAGRSTVEWRTEVSQEGVQELLRFRYTVSGTAANEWILFRLLPAVWFDAVSA